VLVPLPVDIADILPYRLIFAIDLGLWQNYRRYNEDEINFQTYALWLRRPFFLKGTAVEHNPIAPIAERARHPCPQRGKRRASRICDNV
jgi:hypothetical protein